MIYAPDYEDVSDRSFRRGVQTHRATPTYRKPARAPQDSQSARHLECRLLRPEEWLSVAALAPRVPTLEDRLPLVVPSLAYRRGTWERLRARHCASACERGWAGILNPVPGGSWTHSRSRPLEWEATSAASIPPSRLQAESAICWWIRKAWCLRCGFSQR